MVTKEGSTYLDSICRASSRGNARAKAKYEATTDKLLEAVGGPLNGGADDNKQAANKYTDPSSPAVSQEAAEGEGGNLPQIVDDEDDARTGPGSAEPHIRLIMVHSVNSSHQRGICHVCQRLLGAMLALRSYRIRSWSIQDTQ